MKIIVLCYIYPGITILAKWCSLLTAYELRAIHVCYSLCSLPMFLIRSYVHLIFHKMLVSIPGMKRFCMVLVSGCCVWLGQVLTLTLPWDKPAVFYFTHPTFFSYLHQLSLRNNSWLFCLTWSHPCSPFIFHQLQIDSFGLELTSISMLHNFQLSLGTWLAKIGVVGELWEISLENWKICMTLSET